MDKNYLVTKSNYFIMNSSYDLSLEEQKIILTLASMVQPEDEDFKPYNFRIAEFMELVGVDDKSKYIEIPKITKELMKKVFEIQEGNTLIQTAWLSGAKYEKGSGCVELTFSQYLKPYMLQLKQKFTQYQLANVLVMKSKYSPRIYEILKCNEFKKQGFIELDIKELRKLIRADNVYPKYNDFKRYVIERSQKELKKMSDISFEFEEIKTGRKVTSIKFYISSTKKLNKKLNEIQAEKEICATIEEDPREKELIKMVQNIIDEPITKLEAKKLVDVSAGNIDTIKEKYEIAKETTNIKSLVGWLTIAIKHDYKLPTEKVVQGSFNDFEQRKYDFNKLEKGLLGWESEDESEDQDHINFNQPTNDNIDDKLDINLITEQIKKLGELKDMGLLTQEEFKNKKDILLNKI